MLRIFTSWKNQLTSAGFEPANLGSRGEHVTPRLTRNIYCYGDKFIVRNSCCFSEKFIVRNICCYDDKFIVRNNCCFSEKFVVQNICCYSEKFIERIDLQLNNCTWTHLTREWTSLAVYLAQLHIAFHREVHHIREFECLQIICYHISIFSLSVAYFMWKNPYAVMVAPEHLILHILSSELVSVSIILEQGPPSLVMTIG